MRLPWLLLAAMLAFPGLTRAQGLRLSDSPSAGERLAPPEARPRFIGGSMDQAFALEGTGFVLQSAGGSGLGGIGGGGGGRSGARAGGERRRPAPAALPPMEPIVPVAPAPPAGLEVQVLANAERVAAEINSSGGYRADAVNDCYGFMRRVWDPILAERGLPPLPVSDFPSDDWAPITDWARIKPGDVLATHQGHMWGPQWHGGLGMGMRGETPMIFVANPREDVSVHPNEEFRFYHVPTHNLLTGG